MSSSVEVTSERSRLKDLLEERLSCYGYDELERKFFSETGRKGSLPLLVSTPPDVKDAAGEAYKCIRGFIRSNKPHTVSSLKSLFLKTVGVGLFLRPKGLVHFSLIKVRVKSSEEKKNDDVTCGNDIIMTSYEIARRLTEILLSNYALRDEIYCQMMKSTLEARSAFEKKGAWLLVGALLAVAPPTKKILLYLARFIDDHAPLDFDEIRVGLMRSVKNGSRHLPVTYLEFLSIEQKSSIEIAVRLANGSHHFVRVDHGTTAFEVLNEMGNKMKLKDYFGFSLFISLDGKATSLGRRDKIFDCICRCERIRSDRNKAPMYVNKHTTTRKENASSSPGFRLVGILSPHGENGKSGIASNNKSAASSILRYEAYETPWKFWIRKEFFSPWDDELLRDKTATDLCYAQICRGHMTGEYNSVDGRDVSRMAAKRYFIEEGNEISEAKLRLALKSMVPKFWLGNNESELNKWVSDVIESHEEILLMNKDGNSVKSELILTAKNQWSLAFTKVFNGRDVTTGCHVFIGINSEGIKMSSAADGTTLKSLKFYEIQSIKRSGGRNRKSGLEDPDVPWGKICVSSLVVGDDDMIFESHDASEINEILEEILDGLADRSEWAVLEMEDSAEEEEEEEEEALCGGYSRDLNFQSGDVVRLVERQFVCNLNSSSLLCESVETLRKGSVLLRHLKMLFTIAAPNQNFVKLLKIKGCKVKKTRPGFIPEKISNSNSY